MIKVFHFQGTYTTNVNVPHIVQPLVDNTIEIIHFHLGPLEFTSTFNGCVNILRLIIKIKPQSFLMPREL